MRYVTKIELKTPKILYIIQTKSYNGFKQDTVYRAPPEVNMQSYEIASLGMRAILYEVSVTPPKPGLVDRNNSGAHNDMDYFTFMASAAALSQGFIKLPIWLATGERIHSERCLTA